MRETKANLVNNALPQLVQETSMTWQSDWHRAGRKTWGRRKLWTGKGESYKNKEDGLGDTRCFVMLRINIIKRSENTGNNKKEHKE